MRSDASWTASHASPHAPTTTRSTSCAPQPGGRLGQIILIWTEATVHREGASRVQIGGYGTSAHAIDQGHGHGHGA
jgi:hypothetical protein